jgi:hypothetical protein
MMDKSIPGRVSQKPKLLAATAAAAFLTTLFFIPTLFSAPDVARAQVIIIAPSHGYGYARPVGGVRRAVRGVARAKVRRKVRRKIRRKIRRR